MGDYNLDLLKYETHELFLNDLLSHSFLPTIYYPTRITDTTATLIDNIFINGVNNKFDSAIVYSDVSDHLLVVIHYSLELSRNVVTKDQTRRIFDTKSIKSFKVALSNTNWSDTLANTLNQDSPNELYSLFIKTFSSIFEKHFPPKIIRSHKKNSPKKEWITRGLIKSCNRKYVLYKKWVLNPSIDNKLKYASYRNNFD